MQFGDEQTPLSRDMLELQLEFCITSLFGKLGTAQVIYTLGAYDSKNGIIEVTDCEEPTKFWQALCMTSTTMDGQRKLRFKLL
jgi:RNase P/RNase MRP subunit POP5